MAVLQKMDLALNMYYLSLGRDDFYDESGVGKFTQYCQECDLYEGDAVFDCFDTYELIECADENEIAIFDLDANTVGLVDCQYAFTYSFHLTSEDAENNTNAIPNTEAYESSFATVYLRINAESGNFQVLAVFLIPYECNYFECFGNYNLAVCDQDDDVVDGLGLFDLNLIFDNCPNDDVAYTFHETITDAQNNILPLQSPYINTLNPQTIYSRVSLAGDPSVFEIFTHELVVEDCSNFCTEEDVDGILIECLWNIVNYNGSDDLMEWNLDFNTNNQLIVSNSNTTINAVWSTSQSNEGVIVTFSDISGPNIQAISGEWLVVECTSEQLVLHDVTNSNNEIVLDRSCD